MAEYIEAEYIEMEALIKRLKELGIWENSFIEQMLAYGVDSVLENFPSVDIVPVIHGRWEPIISADGGLEGWMFKRCGTETRQKSNYCPSCGSRMDGGSE